MGRFLANQLYLVSQRVKPTRVVLKDETLPFEDAQFDLVISNLALHWVNDVAGLFKHFKRVLKPDGVFLASTLGENTLQELRNSFYLADLERQGSFSPHISPFTRVGDVGNLLTRTKFALPTIDTEDIVMPYRDMFVLMQDLQGMGENNALVLKGNSVPKSTFMAASAIYKTLYTIHEGEAVSATFQVIYLIAWAPHESQPKPLARGSAEKSLGEVFGMHKLSLDSKTEQQKQQELKEGQKQEETKPFTRNLPKSDDFIISEIDDQGNYISNKPKLEEKVEENSTENKESKNENNQISGDSPTSNEDVNKKGNT